MPYGITRPQWVNTAPHSIAALKCYSHRPTKFNYSQQKAGEIQFLPPIVYLIPCNNMKSLHKPIRGQSSVWNILQGWHRLTDSKKYIDFKNIAFPRLVRWNTHVLQRCHMHIMTFWVTSNLTVWSKASSGWQKNEDPHYWPFVREISDQ